MFFVKLKMTTALLMQYFAKRGHDFIVENAISKGSNFFSSRYKTQP